MLYARHSILCISCTRIIGSLDPKASCELLPIATRRAVLFSYIRVCTGSRLVSRCRCSRRFPCSLWTRWPTLTVAVQRFGASSFLFIFLLLAPLRPRRGDHLAFPFGCTAWADGAIHLCILPHPVCCSTAHRWIILPWPSEAVFAALAYNILISTYLL